MEIIENPYNLVKGSLVKNGIKVLTTVLFVWISLNFITSALNQTGQKIRQNQILLYNLEHRVENQTKLEEQYKVVFPYLDKIKTALPLRDDILGFIDVVEDKARASTLNASLAFQESVSGAKTPATRVSGATLLNFTLKISSGNLDNLINFVASLDKIIYFTNLNSLELSNAKDLTQGLEGSLKGEVFLKEETGAE